jgi:general secretion pathway protein J
VSARPTRRPRRAPPRWRRGAGSCPGFTLIELLVALALLALMSATLFGSLALAGRSWDAGEAKVNDTASMRVSHEFLRAQLEGQHAQRLRKVAEFPILFAGERDEMRFAAPLPARVQAGGVWYYRLRLAEVEGKQSLILDRMIPDVTANAAPTFDGSEHSVLATGIASLSISYLGPEPGVAGGAAGFEPAWRERWEDKQRLPQLIRIDVRPEKGAPWPTLYAAPREAPEAACRAWDNARARCAQG